MLTGSSHGGQVLAFALALSVMAATGAGIVLSARIAYGIASYRALPGSLANVSPRFKTPALATIVAVVYYRRRVLSNWQDMLTIGVLPVASVGFLAYIAVKSILSAPAAQNYSLLGFVVVGFILIIVGRFGWRSEFFRIRPESCRPGEEELETRRGLGPDIRGPAGPRLHWRGPAGAVQPHLFPDGRRQPRSTYVEFWP